MHRDAPQTGVLAMSDPKRLLNRRQVKDLTTLSDSTIDRYEALGKFPQRKILSEYSNGRPARVVWMEAEVHAWIERQLGDH